MCETFPKSHVPASGSAQFSRVALNSVIMAVTSFVLMALMAAVIFAGALWAVIALLRDTTFER